MYKKVFLLFVSLLICLGFLPNGSIANGQENIDSGKMDEIPSYFFIHYNGGVQKAVINEKITLIFTNWTDESKSSVSGKIDYHTDSSTQTENITFEAAANTLKKIILSEQETIYYRLDTSDSFKAEEVTSHNVKAVSSVVAQNDNGTSIEELVTVDEYGTVMEEKGLTYYSTNEDNKKIEITKEQYESLNPTSESTPTAKAFMGATREGTNSTGIKADVEIPSVLYATHVQDVGWQAAVSNGEMSGTAGKAKRLESIKVSIDNIEDLGVKYSTHVQDQGWLPFVSDGKESGTTGKGKRLEAIKIELTGVKAANYDIYYRVHAQDYGWLDWVKNGELSGTIGKAKRLEAIEILIKDKENVPPVTTNPEPEEPGGLEPDVTGSSVVYTTHVETYGWQDYVANGQVSGTKGEAKRLEAIKIKLKNISYNGDIIYSTHVQDYGWLNNVSNGDISGTTGKAKRLEAIKIDLTGDITNYYDIYYRVHTQDYGWLGWAKNGMKAGTEGRSKRLEAIEIKLVPKGQGEAVNENDAYKRGRTIFLDPGHGGTDSGAYAGGIREADLNLSVAKKVEALLVKRGFNVKMSRTNNTTVELLDRPKMANELKVDLFVSIHTNSGPTAAYGIESYYYKYNPDYPSTINESMHNNPDRISKSMTLTNLIQENMVAYTGANDRGPQGASFAVIREAAMPATLLEIGFISNSSERQKLVTDTYQSLLAKAIDEGINEYFKIY